MIVLKTNVKLLSVESFENIFEPIATSSHI